MATGRTIITDAAKLLGVYQKGETLDGDEASDGLRLINDMISGWNNEKLMLYQIVEVSHSLTAGTASYTIGSSGTINTTRPIRIEKAFIRDSDNNDTQLTIFNNRDWSDIPLKSQNNTTPSVLYYRANYPLGTINLHDAPDSNLTLYLECWDQLDALTLDGTVSLPPGYERALKFNFAVDWAPYWGRSVSQEIASVAVSSKAGIKDANNTEMAPLKTQWNRSHGSNFLTTIFG